MEYFVGIDIGTTALKGVAFSRSGLVLYEQSRDYPLIHDKPEESEIQPGLIWAAFQEVVENILQHFKDEAPALISFSAAMHSLMAVDIAGKPLSRLLTWADNRAAGIALRLRQDGSAASLYVNTGVPVHPMSPFCKLRYWNENPPSWHVRAFRFIGIKEYIFFKLFGVYVVDVSIASATGLLNVNSEHWDPQVLELAGVRQEQLSEVVPIGKIFTHNRVISGLENVPFIIGGSDGAMANAGTVGNDEKSLVVSIGTSSAVRRTVKTIQIDPGMRCFCYCLSPGAYLLGGAGNNGAIVLQWLKEQILESPLSFPELLAKAEQVPPGAEGLLFLPYLLGERAPIWNPSARGVIFGLTATHSQSHLIRAAMESVIFCVYAMSRAVIGRTAPDKIFVTGGFARNRFWVQLLADLFNLPVELSATVENAAWGAVRTGAGALRVLLPQEAAGEEIIYPVEKNVSVYAQLYRNFESLNQLLLPAFR